jgi:outer membrane PBP1 activator LpoA protein
LLRPALRFFIPDQSMPVYATSDIYEVNEQSNGDLDGVRFPDMPWMIGADEKTRAIHTSVRNYWPGSGGSRDRLYAFGYDAFQLIPLLTSARPQARIFSGLTGRLAVDQNGRVRRQLDWASINSGQAVPLNGPADPISTAASFLH